MASIADVVAFDGAATPVSHTLKPISIKEVGGKSVALWREGLSNVPLDAQVTLVAVQEKLKSGVIQETLTLTVPSQESIATTGNSAGYVAAPKVAFEDKVVLTQFIHPRSTEASRLLARWMMTNIARGNSSTNATVSSGMASDLYDRVIFPT